MSCTLTSDLPLGCRGQVGGMSQFLITELENKSTITSSDGLITAMTLTTGKKFWQYGFEKEQAEPVEKIVTSVENGTTYYDQNVKLRLNKVEVTKRNELVLVSQNRTMIIFKDKNGQYWLFGMNNGMDLAPSETKWGKAMGDFNGYDLEFAGKEEEPAYQVQTSVIAGLLVAAS